MMMILMLTMTDDVLNNDNDDNLMPEFRHSKHIEQRGDATGCKVVQDPGMVTVNLGESEFRKTCLLKVGNIYVSFH